MKLKNPLSILSANQIGENTRYVKYVIPVCIKRESIPLPVDSRLKHAGMTWGLNGSPIFTKPKCVQYTICFLLSIIFIAFLFTLPAFAQEPTDDQVNSVAEKLNCPTCQSLNLADCRTQTCAQWRDQIKDLLAEGYSEEEVLNIYVERYGEEVLQEPPQHGVGLYVWLLPLLALLAGAVWLIYIVRQWSSKEAEPVAVEGELSPQQDVSDDYLKQVEQDLQDM